MNGRVRPPDSVNVLDLSTTGIPDRIAEKSECCRSSKELDSGNTDSAGHVIAGYISGPMSQDHRINNP